MASPVWSETWPLVNETCELCVWLRQKRNATGFRRTPLCKISQAEFDIELNVVCMKEKATGSHEKMNYQGDFM